MAQYDIHRNRGRNKEAIPFLVDVQSNEFKSKDSRLIVPLLRGAGFPAFAPVLHVGGEQVVADALVATALSLDKLGPIVRALTADEVVAVMNALDRIISSAYS